MHKRQLVLMILTMLVLLSFYSRAQAKELSDNTVYFVVAEAIPYHGDSYVLPLNDPMDIAFARWLISEGGFRIVNAVISSGSDGINRDVLAAVMPEWSWHVSEFIGFSELSIELCDGWPTWIEQNPGMWNGQICFWSYTVVWEITWSVPMEQTTWGRIKKLYRE